MLIASLPPLPSTVTLSNWPSAVPPVAARSIATPQLDVGAREVVDPDVVGAALGLELDQLDVVDVHRDVADVAGEAARARRWPRSSKFSAVLAPLNEQRIDAGLALDDVAAVAGIPLEDVVAGAEEGDVVALVAVDEIVAVAAEEGVDAVAAENGVVASTAVDFRLMRERDCPWREGVVTTVHVEDEIFGGPDVEAERRGIEAVEAHARTVGRDMKTSAPLPPLTSAVSMPSPPSNRSVSSPGFQMMWSLPASPNTWSSPAPPVSVSLPSPPRRRRYPGCRVSTSLPAPPLRVRLIAPAASVEASMVSLPAPPLTIS